MPTILQEFGSVFLAALHALIYVLGPFLLTALVALASAASFALFFEKGAYRFREACRISIVFGGYAFVLGYFVSLAGTPLATTIIGAVTATATTYLAIIYSQGAQTAAAAAANANANATPAPTLLMTVLPALTSFFVSFPLMIKYMSNWDKALNILSGV